MSSFHPPHKNGGFNDDAINLRLWYEMATDVDQACYEWSHDELAGQDDSQEGSVSEMLDHGSISFGRYSVESLSWEKRSVFTYNKCQEELEKFKSPGLVAQKKAYFEEYYKRIRTMKALQENQQTELTLDYGGDGSISSQTWDEEETVVHLDHFLNESANVDYFLAKESRVHSRFDKEQIFHDVPQTGQLDSESTLSSHDLSIRSIEELGNGVNSSNFIQMHDLDTESIVDESLLRSTEVTAQHDIIDLDNDRISRKNENSILDIEPEEAAEGIVIPNIALEIVVHKTEMITKSKPRDLMQRPANTFVQSKIKAATKKHDDHHAVSRVKEFVVSARNCLKLESTTKSDMVKSLHGLKCPVQKKTGKAETNIGSSKIASNKVSSINKSTSVASDKSLMEVRSNVTIPRPFSLATERRAAAPSGNKEVAKTSNEKMARRLTLPSSPSLNHSKGVLNVQASPKKLCTIKATTNVIKSKGQEKTRGKDGFRHRTPALDSPNSQSIVAIGLSPPKARSVNLPARDKSNPSGRIEHRSATSVAVNKQKEIKEDSRPRNSRALDTKFMVPPSGTSMVGSKKIIPSLNNNPTLGMKVKKPQLGGLSLDGRKPRQEMPRWR
ncbi:hypothetical protein J5N97_020898 [Dioscorea zingiberensis]|uniref:Uncharacterized protein n=1 Tax=Dioscorea zingiberensis TaxID=325984 RepID=A0A9D5CH93_9LILI|nr:hypothetical protein J5N97_020898 [Dioscorea zingiberensis]